MVTNVPKGYVFWGLMAYNCSIWVRAKSSPGVSSMIKNIESLSHCGIGLPTAIERTPSPLLTNRQRNRGLSARVVRRQPSCLWAMLLFAGSVFHPEMAIGQDAPSRAAAQAPSKARAASPVTMTECEGTNNCATWTFLGAQGNVALRNRAANSNRTHALPPVNQSPAQQRIECAGSETSAKLLVGNAFVRWLCFPSGNGHRAGRPVTRCCASTIKGAGRQSRHNDGV